MNWYARYSITHLVPSHYPINVDYIHNEITIWANFHYFRFLVATCPIFPFCLLRTNNCYHYGDVILGAIASQITILTIVYSTVYSDADQRKHQSSASLAFVRGIHRGPVNSPHKLPLTRIMFPFDDVIMTLSRNDSWMAEAIIHTKEVIKTVRLLNIIVQQYHLLGQMLFRFEQKISFYHNKYCQAFATESVYSWNIESNMTK